MSYRFKNKVGSYCSCCFFFLFSFFFSSFFSLSYEKCFTNLCCSLNAQTINHSLPLCLGQQQNSFCWVSSTTSNVHYSHFYSCQKLKFTNIFYLTKSSLTGNSSWLLKHFAAVLTSTFFPLMIRWAIDKHSWKFICGAFLLQNLRISGVWSWGKWLFEGFLLCIKAFTYETNCLVFVHFLTFITLWFLFCMLCLAYCLLSGNLPPNIIIFTLFYS